MRYYFVTNDKNEIYIDLNQIMASSDGIKEWEVEFKTQKIKVYSKKIAQKVFVSLDKRKWQKVATPTTNQIYTLKNETLKIYAGFKPSGLEANASGALVTQMPGKIVKIMIKPGDKVNKGQTLLILEAMKMENEIKAHKDGIIKSINVNEAQSVDSGVLLIELE